MTNLCPFKEQDYENRISSFFFYLATNHIFANLSEETTKKKKKPHYLIFTSHEFYLLRHNYATTHLNITSDITLKMSAPLSEVSILLSSHGKSQQWFQSISVAF